MGVRNHTLLKPNLLGRARFWATLKHGPANPIAAIASLRRRAAQLIWAETILQAAIPSAFLLLAYSAAAIYGLANPWLFAAILISAIFTLIRGGVKIRAPSRQAIDRRIESASRLKHRPLSTLDDEPEEPSPIAAALWQAHRQQTLATLRTARIGAPAPAAASTDPLALRGLLLLLLLSGLIINGPTRLAGAFALPAWPWAGPTISAWLTPPGYASQPPQILQPNQSVTALPGSQITIIANGLGTAPVIRLAGALIPAQAAGGGAQRADATLQKSGTLTIGPWWRRLATFPITVTPPAAPSITLTSIDIIQTNHLKLHWSATDPYGLNALIATIAPAGYPTALTQTYTLPTTTGQAAAILDLSTSPFHSLPVTLKLTARNAANVAASTTWPASLTLPGLSLHDLTAIDLDRLRQKLALTPGIMRQVATASKSLSQAPLSTITAAADLKLSVLTCAMWLRQIAPQPAVDEMLALIQEIEAGPDYEPQKALSNANQALTSALQRGLTGQPISAAELQKLLAAVQAALASHMAAIQPPPASQQPPATMDMSALDRMAQKIAADEAAGRTAQAAQELQQLQNLLRQLAAAKPMTAAQMAQAEAAAAAQSAIAQMTQGEAAVLNNTHQGNFSPTGQAAIQSQLGQTARALAKAGIHVPGLGDAGAAMSSAQGALSQQNGHAAESQENAAIQALQQAAAALAKAQRGQFGIGQSQGQPGGSGQDSVNGGQDDDSAPLDIGTPPNPARAIEQQIITNDSAPSLPPPPTPTTIACWKTACPGTNQQARAY